MQLNKIGVVGAGTMGSSITLSLVSHGYSVALKDVNDGALASGLQTIDRLIKSRMEKGLTPSEASRYKERIRPTTDFNAFSNLDFVIEAVPESIKLKQVVFENLDQCCKSETIFASNTSSLSISQLAAFTHRPDKVVGMHFFNPAHLMKLVEIIPGIETSEDTVNAATSLGRSLDKFAVRVEECASFLVNRLLGRYMNEALWCLQEGLASVEEIDKAACDYAMPIGPLALRDMNGADVGLSVAKYNYEEYGERYSPPPILEEMVERKLLGQKTLAGFYLYDEKTRKRTVPNPQITELLRIFKNKGEASKIERKNHQKFEVERLFLPMINEAFLVLQDKICARHDLDPALQAGLGMRKGPLAIANDMGLSNCLSKIEQLQNVYPERFRPAPLLKRYVWAKRRTIS